MAPMITFRRFMSRMFCACAEVIVGVVNRTSVACGSWKNTFWSA